MLELHNVSKTYQIDDGLEVKALQNIDLLIRDSGLSFIVGKSGSGKTTLLNIVGCLDTCDSGEIYIDGKLISQTKIEQLNEYRNRYVGFVFQEYNLLNDMTVEDNLKIALELLGEKDFSKIALALEKVGMAGYENRRVSSLSGGQKQRIAIARAIIKSPKLILADEPTGNLDSETSKGIFDLLKELSKEISVLVVSHDEESANIYADCIIRMQDGKVVQYEDRIKFENKEEKLPTETLGIKSSRLSFKVIADMAFKNIKKRWVRLLMTIIVLMLSLSAIEFSLAATYNDTTKIFLKACEKYNQESVAIVKKENYYSQLEESISVNNSSLTKYDINQINNIIGPTIELRDSQTYWAQFFDATGDLLSFKMLYCGPSVDEINNFGMRIVSGKYPQKRSQIMISKIFAELIMLSKSDDSSIERLLGKHIGDYEIVGIVDTNPNMNEIQPFLDLYKVDPKSLNATRKYISFANELTDSIHSSVFFSESVFKYGLEDSVTVNYIGYPLFTQKCQYRDIVVSNDVFPVIIDENFNSNQIAKAILPFDKIEQYASFLDNGGFDSSFYDQYDLSSLAGWNECLNEHEIFINLNYVDIEDNLKKQVNIMIAGVHNIDGQTIIGNNFVSKVLSENKYLVNSVQLKLDKNLENNEATLKWMLETRTINDNGYVYIPLCGFWGEIERMISAKNAGWMPVFGTIGIVLAIIAILMIWNFTYTTIEDNKKNLGILISLGARTIDVSIIYVFESALVWILSNLLSYALIPLYRFIFGDVNECIKAFNYTALDIISVLLLSLVIIALGSAFSIIKMIKKKPIDIMRE